MYMWDFKSPGVGKLFWHKSHLCGFSCEGKKRKMAMEKNAFWVLRRGDLSITRITRHQKSSF